MKGIILTGGGSAELQPLTCTRNSSMLEVCGVPLVEYTVQELERNGISDIIISADRFTAQTAEYFDDGRDKVPAFSFVKAGTLSGEAVYEAARSFDIPDGENVVIARGDVLAQRSIREALSFHRESGADITVCVTHSDSPEKHIAVSAGGDKLREVIPYPPTECCASELIMTGTVIVKSGLILNSENTEGEFYTDVISRLLNSGAKAVVYEEKGYFMQIREPADIIKMNRDIMNGRYPSGFSGIMKSDDGRFKGVQAEFPVYIGKNAVISEGAVLSAYTSVGDNAFVGRNAVLKGCAAGKGCYIGESACINGAVLADGVRFSSEASAEDGAVIGDNAVIGAGAFLGSGVRIWTGRHIEPFAVVKESVRRGDPRRLVLDDEGITGEINSVITPETAAQAGSAAASLGKRIAVGFKGGNAAFSLALAFASGVSAAGCEAWFLGEVTEPELACCVKICGAAAGCFINAGVSAGLSFVSHDGLPLSRAEERLVESGLNGSVYRSSGGNDFGDIRQCSGIRDIYSSRLTKKFPASFSGVRAIVNTPSGRTEKICRRLLEGRNDREGIPVVFHISGDGRKISAYTDETGYVAQDKLIMLGCMDEFEQGRDSALPFSFPRAADVLAERYGRRVLRFAYCSDGSDSEARSLAADGNFMGDGIHLMLKVTALMSRKGMTLKELCGSLPGFAAVSRYVAVDSPRSRSIAVMRKLGGGTAGNDGVMIDRNGCRVIVRPVKTGRGMMMFAEGFDIEAASELCDDIQERIKKLCD